MFNKIKTIDFHAILDSLESDLQSKKFKLAAEQIHSYFFKSLIQYFKHRGLAVPDAEILANTVIANLIKSIRRKNFNGQVEDLDNYVYGIAKNVYKSIKTVKQAQLINFEEDVDYTTEPNVYENLLRKDLTVLIDQVLGHIGEQCGQILNLWMRSFSHEEIANLLGFTMGSIKVKIFRCKQNLKTLIEQNPALYSELKELQYG